MGIAGWLGGWRTAGDYGNGLTHAGLAVLALGAMRYFGGLTRAVAPAAGDHRTTPNEQLGAMRRALGEQDSAFAFMLRMGVAGLLPIAPGQLLR